MIEPGIFYGKPLRLHYSQRCVHDVEFRPGYGVIAPSLCTTNGNPELIRLHLHPDDLKDFNDWLLTLPENVEKE